MLRHHWIYIILLFAMLFVSCGSLQIEKRTHRKGFHVHWNKQMKSTKDKACLEGKYAEKKNNFQSKEICHEETIASSDTEITQSVEPVSGTNDITTVDNDPKGIDYCTKVLSKSRTIEIENYSVNEEDKRSAQSGKPRTGLIILGIVLIVLGGTLSAFIFALGGELFGLLGAISIVPGVIALFIGLRSRKGGSRSSGNRGGKINLFALFAWILLPICFVGILSFIAGPMILTFLTIATIQFKRNPGKYKGKWMVDILWILIVVAAIVYAITALLVLLFW